MASAALLLLSIFLGYWSLRSLVFLSFGWPRQAKAGASTTAMAAQQQEEPQPLAKMPAQPDIDAALAQTSIRQEYLEAKLNDISVKLDALNGMIAALAQQQNGADIRSIAERLNLMESELADIKAKERQIPQEEAGIFRPPPFV